MRSSCSEGKLLRVVDRKKAGIHAGNYVGRRRSFRRWISMRAVTPGKKQQCQDGDQKKTNFQTFVFHE
jgi:hypothetical protein